MLWHPRALKVSLKYNRLLLGFPLKEQLSVFSFALFAKEDDKDKEEPTRPRH